VSARTAGRRRHEEPAEFDDPEGDPAADGVMVRLAARVMENPAMSGGLLVMALTATAVVSNALFLQHGQHPEPWFATRPALAMTPDGGAVVVPDPRPRGTPEMDPPAPRIQPAVAPAAAVRPASTQLVADLQRALGERGLYDGKVDGLFGARTRAAISAYEKSQGLPVTGVPSAEVLDRIVTASIPPKPIATPAASSREAPVPVKAVAIDAGAGEGPQLLSYPPKPASAPAAEAAPVVTKASAPVAAADPPAQREDIGARRTLSVQKALNQIGYGPVPEDGVTGEATIAAIRRFELDNGLPITGAAGDTLIERLVAIGAMEAA
jgi:peptidoglycan hydrolase-like protein with peptidoglycan-binding domain